MMTAGPQFISVPQGGIPIPAGFIVGYQGTVASLAAYSSEWELCDGADSTPDLADKFVIAAGGTYAYDSTGGSGGGLATGTTNTNGAHLGPSGSVSRPSGGVTVDRLNDIAGDHSHTFSQAVDAPPYYSTAYIMAKVEGATLPPGAVAWANAASAPAGCEDHPDLPGRLSRAVTNDTRATGGTTAISQSTTTSSNGDHMHYAALAGTYAVQTPYATLMAGAHNHTFTITGTRTLPPYLALRAIRSLIALEGVPLNFCGFYYGSLLALSSQWAECDGAGGRPDARNRMIIGVDGSHALGSTGGAATTSISGSIGSKTVNHSHANTPNTANGAYHAAYDWIHDHTYSGSVGLPAYRALYFIIAKG